MSDGRVVIDVSLDHSGVRSDARVIEQLLNGLGRNAGQTMDENFTRHSNDMTRQARRTSQNVNNEFRNPIELRVNLHDNASGGARNTFRNVSNEADETKRHLDTLKGAFEGTFVANIAEKGLELATEGVKKLIETGVEYNATQTKMQTTWETLTGSASKGKVMVDMVNNFQRSTGYATDTLDEMEQKIYHIKGSASETNIMTKAFTTLGDAMGLSNDKLVGVSEQFSQMMSTGKAYSGDLNIMTNAFPAFGDAIVKYTGKSMGEIRKMASNGKLDAQTVENTLIQMSHKYASATENTMKTTQGLWRTMQSNFGRLAGDFTKPIFDMKKSGFKDLSDWLSSKQADKFFTDMGTKVSEAVGKVTDFIGFLNKNRDSVFKFAKAFGVLALSIMAIKKTSAIVGDINTVLGGLGRLRTGYSETALASTRMADTAVRNSDRMALSQEGESLAPSVGSRVARNGSPVSSGSRAGAVVGGVAAAASVVGMGLTMTGSKWGMIAGTVMTFLPTLINLGKILFDVGKVVFTFIRSFASLDAIIALASNPIGWIVAGVIALGLAFYEAYKHIQPFHDWVNKTASSLKGDFLNTLHKVQDFFKPAIKTTVDWGDTIDKSTQKAMDAYLKLSDKANRALETLVVTGKKVSQQDVGELVKPYKEMADQIKKHLDDTQASVATTFAGLKTTNKQEYDAIVKQTKDATESRKSTIGAIEGAIEDIYKKAAKQHRSITADEQEKINDLQTNMNRYAVQSMTKSQKEQEIILGKLKDHTSQLSADQAAAIVKNAKKQENETIKSADNTYKQSVKSANDKYKKVSDLADQEYFVNHSISKKQYDDLIKNAQNTRDESIKAAKYKRDHVVDKAQDEYDQTVKYAKNQAKGHVDQVDWETGKVLSGWDSLKTNTLKVINDILGFFGLPKINDKSPSKHQSSGSSVSGSATTSTASLAAYASGTDGHKGGLALVGDGTGSNSGSEAIVTPDGNLTFSPAKPTVMNLPMGTSVLSATNTRKLFGNVPHYANGTGDFLNWIMKSPKYLITKAFDTFGINNFGSNLSQFGKTFSTIGNGAVSMATKAAINWAKSKLSDWTGGFLSMPSHVSGNLKTWMSEAMSIGNIPSSWLNGLLSIAMHESGGNPNSVNRWDSNARAGHPSMGLMQMISSTFQGNEFAGHNNILNPVDSILAAYNYIRKQYGNINNVPGIRSMMQGGSYVGYANGTDYSIGGQVVVGENEPELIQTKDGRMVVANKATSFDDFMAGSSVTPLSKIPHYANGISVGNPALNNSIKLSSGAKEIVVQVNIDPITTNLIMDGKLIGKTITDVQNINNERNLRLKGES